MGETYYLGDLFSEYDKKVCTTVVGGSDALPPEQENLLHDVLVKFKDFLPPTPGFTGIVEHCINTGDHKPVRSCLRPVKAKKQELMDQCVDKLLAQDLKHPSTSLGPNKKWKVPFSSRPPTAKCNISGSAFLNATNRLCMDTTWRCELILTLLLVQGISPNPGS